MCSAASRWRSTRIGRRRPAARTRSNRSLAGRAEPPQRAAARQRHPLVAERDLGQRPALVHLADQVGGRQAHVGEEHLVERVGAGHLDDRADLDAGRVHRADEVRDALVLGHVGVGAGDEDAELRVLGQRRPDLLAVDDPLVAVAHGPGAEVGQVAAGLGLAEQLAPDLLGRQQREEVALLLLLGAGVHERRAGPADADLVRRAPHAGPPQLVVDDQLVDRVGVEAPRPGPVRRHVAGLGQLPAGRRRGARPARSARPSRRGSSSAGMSKSTAADASPRAVNVVRRRRRRRPYTAGPLTARLTEGDP